MEIVCDALLCAIHGNAEGLAGFLVHQDASTAAVCPLRMSAAPSFEQEKLDLTLPAAAIRVRCDVKLNSHNSRNTGFPFQQRVRRD